MATKKKKKAALKKKTATKKKTAKKPAKKKASTKKKVTKKKTAAKKKPAKKTTAKKKTAAKKKTTKKKTAAKKKPAKKKTAKKASSKKAAPKKAAAAPKKKVPTPPAKPVLLRPKNTETKQFTQSEFYECMRGYCGFTNRKEAKEFYAQFTEMLQTALKSGYRVALPGLGKLQVKKSKARMGINPLTREPIRISAKKRVRFTPMKALKEAVL